MKDKKLNIRTDFCDELIQKEFKDETLHYVVEKNETCKITKVKIKHPENTLKKEMGDYITIDFENIYDAKQRKGIIQTVYENLKQLMNDYTFHKILVVGLGNRRVTSDALGPKTCDRIIVTSHLFRYENADLSDGMRDVSTLAPGVMGQTGMESAQIVSCITSLCKPDLVIVVDALATSSLSRINAAIQINNVGIQPGSGVGNHRLALDKKRLKCPVIAIGVATVMSIRSLLYEALEEEQESLLSDIERKIDLGMVVTPKNIDDAMVYLCEIIAEGINRFLHPDFENL